MQQNQSGKRYTTGKKHVKEQIEKRVHLNTVNTPVNHVRDHFSSKVKQLQEKFVSKSTPSTCYSQP